MKKKYLFLLFIICLFIFKNASSQRVYDRHLSDKIKETELIFTKIPKLDDLLENCPYSRISNCAEQMSKQIDSAFWYIENLNGIIGVYKDYKEIYTNKVCNYVYLAYMNLALQSIYQKKEYLEIFNIADQFKAGNYRDAYKTARTSWQQKGQQAMSDTYDYINDIQKLDSGNIHIPILESINLYYQNRKVESIKKMKNYVSQLEILYKKNKELESMLGFSQSWLAFLYFKSDSLPKALQVLDKTQAYLKPVANISWAQNLSLKISNNKLKNKELKFPKIDFSKVKDINISGYEYKFEFKNNDSVLGKLIKPFSLNDANIPVGHFPDMLIEKSKRSWEGLSNIESNVWAVTMDTYKEVRDNPKLKKKKYIYKKIYPTIFEKKRNKKYVINNHFTRFRKIIKIYNNFEYCKQGWSNIINSNPDVVLYRIYRIKCNIGKYYLAVNYPDYKKFYKYLRQPGGNKNNDVIVKLDREFSDVLPISEIKTDLDYLEANYPDNLLYLLTKAEVTAFVNPSEDAVSKIDKITSLIPEHSEILANDPFDLLNFYKSYVYFKNKDSKNASIIEAMLKTSQNHEVSEWAIELRKRLNFTDGIKDVYNGQDKKARKNLKNFNYYIPEQAPPVIFFPDRTEISLVSSPPLMLPISRECYYIPCLDYKTLTLGIIPGMDLTNTDNKLKNSLADKFTTALFHTKRFNLIGKAQYEELNKMTAEEIKKNLVKKESMDIIQSDKASMKENEKTNNMEYKPDASINTTQNKKNVEYDDDMSKYIITQNEEYKEKKQKIIDQLTRDCNILLEIIVSTDKKSNDGEWGKVGINYNIKTTKEEILYSGKKDIPYRFDQNGSLECSDEPINSVADEIKNYFPNTDIKLNWHIIKKDGDVITVNAGKKENIIDGLKGYVVISEKTQDGYSRCPIQEFVITTVDLDYFRAKLIGDEFINSKIKLGDAIMLR